MKPFFPLVLTAAACFLLTSCLTDSVNPLSSPSHAQADPRFVGDWRGGTSTEPNISRFSITKGPWMHVEILPDHSADKPKSGELPESYDFFPTVIGQETFLNVVMIGKDDQGHPTKTYTIVRYKFVGNRVLHMWLMSQEVTAAAIRAGKLHGHIKPEDVILGKSNHPELDVTLTDTGASLTKFIQASDLDQLFDNEMNGFTRVEEHGKSAR